MTIDAVKQQALDVSDDIYDYDPKVYYEVALEAVQGEIGRRANMLDDLSDDSSARARQTATIETLVSARNAMNPANREQIQAVMMMLDILQVYDQYPIEDAPHPLQDGNE